MRLIHCIPICFYHLKTKLCFGGNKSQSSKPLPQLPDELGEDVLQLGSQVPPLVVLHAGDALHLSRQSIMKPGHDHTFKSTHILRERVPTMTLACDARVLASMMKRMTLMKPSAALTTSLVWDDSSRHTFCSSCSLVVEPMASGGEEGTGSVFSVCGHSGTRTHGNGCDTHLYTRT